MKLTVATLAALILLAPAAFAGGSPPDAATDAAADTATSGESEQDAALKQIEQGFSIPAADGAATKDKKNKK